MCGRSSELWILRSDDDGAAVAIFLLLCRHAHHRTEPHDVLLGRGPFFNNFEGNLRFHKLIKERKLQYNSTGVSRPEKKRIAREVVAVVHASGGRFLKQEDPDDPYNDNWCEVESAVSEEKVKQALREKQHHTIHGAKSTSASTNDVMNQRPELPLSSQATGFPAAAMNSTAGLSNIARPFSPGLFAQEFGRIFATSQQEMALQSLLMNPDLANSVLNNPLAPESMKMLLIQVLCCRTGLTASVLQQTSALQQNSTEKVSSPETEPLQDTDKQARRLQQDLLQDWCDGNNTEAVNQTIDWNLESKKDPSSNDAGSDEIASPRDVTETEPLLDADEEHLQDLVQGLLVDNTEVVEQGIDLDLENEKELSRSGAAGSDEFAGSTDDEHLQRFCFLPWV